MKHSKATLKLNINVRKAIDLAVNSIGTLQKIEYTADWSNFPNSLEIMCYLVTIAPENSADKIAQEEKIGKMVQHCFLKQGIKFRDMRKNITLKVSHES